jgi:hypothetical protein
MNDPSATQSFSFEIGLASRTLEREGALALHHLVHTATATNHRAAALANRASADADTPVVQVVAIGQIALAKGMQKIGILTVPAGLWIRVCRASSKRLIFL